MNAETLVTVGVSIALVAFGGINLVWLYAENESRDSSMTRKLVPVAVVGVLAACWGGWLIAKHVPA